MIDVETARRYYEEHDSAHVFEYHFKLIKLQDQLYTATGKRLAERRHGVMVAYFQELEREVAGER